MYTNKVANLVLPLIDYIKQREKNVEGQTSNNVYGDRFWEQRFLIVFIGHKSQNQGEECPIL